MRSAHMLAACNLKGLDPVGIDAGTQTTHGTGLSFKGTAMRTVEEETFTIWRA